MTHPRRSFPPAYHPTVGRPELQSPACTELQPRSVLLGHLASVTVTAAAILSSTSAFLFLYLCPPRTTALSPAFHPPPSFPARLFHRRPSATACLLDQRPGDGTTRKAGFKIIMARAILITVARTTTISAWHHHYYTRARERER